MVTRRILHNINYASFTLVIRRCKTCNCEKLLCVAAVLKYVGRSAVGTDRFLGLENFRLSLTGTDGLLRRYYLFHKDPCTTVKLPAVILMPRYEVSA